MNKQRIDHQSNDEIDLIEISSTLWKGKWKIILTLLIVVGLGVIAFYFIPKQFVSTVRLKPINSIQENNYFLFNQLGTDDKKESSLYKIEANYLQKIYVEILSDKKLIEHTFEKYKLLNSNQFKTIEKYKKALKKLMNEVKIYQLKINDEITSINWELSFKYVDEIKWKKALKELDEKATEKTRKTIIKQFNLSIDSLVHKKNREINKLDEKVQNSLESYRAKLANRLAYLEEQAAIARKLNISNNTIESQNFNSTNGVVTTIKTESPFYLRGYNAIEKEIALIKARKDDRLFVKDLITLKQEKNILLQDDLVDEYRRFFKQTPVATNNNFRAIQPLNYLTEIKYKYSLFIVAFLLSILGFIIGTLWVLISSALRKNK